MSRHGMSATPEYASWASMVHRCTNPEPKDEQYYAGKGIVVCDRWLRSFKNFLADMGQRPPGTSVDRIRTTGNYEPGNCRWATPLQQSINKINTRMITANGRVQCLEHWAREMKIRPATIRHRLASGWSDSDAVLISSHQTRPQWSRCHMSNIAGSGTDVVGKWVVARFDRHPKRSSTHLMVGWDEQTIGMALFVCGRREYGSMCALDDGRHRCTECIAKEVKP